MLLRAKGAHDSGIVRRLSGLLIDDQAVAQTATLTGIDHPLLDAKRIVRVQLEDRPLEAYVLRLHVVLGLDSGGSPSHDLVDDVTGHVVVCE